MKIDYLKGILKEALRASFKIELEDIEINLAPQGFGEFSTSVPLRIAKVLKKSPLEIAEGIIACLRSDYLMSASAAAPGYLNFTMSPLFYTELLKEIEEKKTGFLNEKSRNLRVQIEFVSANPTGPVHVGNGRGGIIGDVLANLMTIDGYSVEREYYVNDAGSKMDVFAASIAHYYLKKCSAVYPFPEDGYRGKYIEEIADRIVNEEGNSLVSKDHSSLIEILKEKGKRIMLDSISNSLEKFGVRFDNFFFESSLYSSGKIYKTLDFFRRTSYIYEKDGAIWFRSTQFGDDKDRVLVRNTGEPTYTLADAAYHMDKWERGFSKVIDIWGADHFGHIVPMQALIRGMGLPAGFLDIIIYQMVHLFEQGKEITMSKHSGSFITLDDLVDEVGRDAARFFFLLKSADSHLNFDLTLAKEQSMNNPIYYVQYTFARLKSILREAGQRDIDSDKIEIDLVSQLTRLEETELLRRIAFLKEDVASATRQYEVHRIPFITISFCQAINSFYQKHKVLGSGQMEKPRLILVKACLHALSILFSIMGIEQKEKM